MVEKRIFWITLGGQKHLTTINLVPGMKVHNEKLVEKDGIEHRIWNPNRSKLATAINNGLEYLPINIGSKVLCFNASEITVSHISDIVGNDGIVYFVTDKKLLSNNFLKKMHPIRSNIIIIQESFSRDNHYSEINEPIDFAYLDLAQNDLTDAITNWQKYLKVAGFFLLSFNKNNFGKSKKTVNLTLDEALIQNTFKIIQIVQLGGFFKTYSMVLASFNTEK